MRTTRNHTARAAYAPSRDTRNDAAAPAIPRRQPGHTVANCAIVGPALVLALLLPARRATAQQGAPGDTAVALPIRPDRTIAFDTDEGTWISLDVSPDGRTLVFDLMGDLYTAAD